MSDGSREQQGPGHADLASVVQSLDTPEQQKAAAESVIGALSSDAKQDLAASVVQGLDTPEQQKAAAESVIGALPTDAKQDLAATVVQGLDTPEQQKAAAEGVIGAMTSDAKQDLAASVVRGLDTPEQQKSAAEGVLSAMPAKQRQQVAKSLLGSPDKKTRQVLWYIVVSTLVAAIFVFGIIAFVLIYQKKPAEAPLALATTALGGVVGLVATSPGSDSSD